MKKKLLILLALLIALPAFAVDLEMGEKVNIWIEVSERDNASFTIQTANFSVMTSSGGVIQAETTATIDGAKVYGLVDTSVSAFTDGLYAQVKFTYVIGDEVFIFYVPILMFQYIHE